MFATRFAAATVISCAALGLGGGAAAAPTWLAPVALATSDRAVDAALAVSSTGEAVAVWDREVGDVCLDQPANPACVHVVEARSLAAHVWAPAVEIARPGVGAAPQVAVDARGDAVAVWSHDIGVDRVLQASIRTGATGVWREPVDLSEPVPSLGAHPVALDAAGNATVAWADATTVRAETRPAASGVWGAPVPLSRPGAAAPVGPSLAVDAAGDAVAVWSLSGVVQASFRSGASGAWDGPVELGAGTDPRVAIDAAGAAVAVWTDGQTVRASTRSAAWSAPVDLGAGADPAVAVDSAGHAAAVWVAAGTVQASFRVGPWTPPAELGPGSAPRVALGPTGNAVALWIDGTVRAALRPVASGTWLPAVDVSAPGALGAGLMSDVAVWLRGGAAEAAELAGTGPVLSPPSVPARAVAGAPVDLSVEAVPWASPLAGRPVWSFGDGGSATGSRVRHVYAAAGAYEVTVTQSDAAGGTSSASARVVVAAPALANLVRPSIRGRPRVGATLTCLRGRWRGTPPIRYAYGWLRNRHPISGARRSAYRIRPRDAGTRLVCRVVASSGRRTRAARSRAVRIEAA